MILKLWTVNDVTGKDPFEFFFRIIHGKILAHFELSITIRFKSNPVHNGIKYFLKQLDFFQILVHVQGTFGRNLTEVY